MLRGLSAFILSAIYVMQGVVGVATLGVYRPGWAARFTLVALKRQLEDEVVDDS